MTIETLHQKFIHKLPGETAQERMSPQPKYVEGKEGIHQGHPISSAVMMLLVPYFYQKNKCREISWGTDGLTRW